MSSQQIKTFLTLAIAAWVVLVIPADSFARRPFWRMQARRNANESFVSATYATAPVPDIAMEFFKCTGEGNNCGIIARGTVESQPSNPVTAVFMLVNQACPASCSGGSFSCTSPNPSQVRGSVIWNGSTSKYDITFGDITTAGDRRIVKCSEVHTVCIVVCYQNGPCVSEEFRLNPADTWKNGAGQGGLTMDCAYCNPTEP